MTYPEGMQIVTVTAGSSLDFFGNHEAVTVTVKPELGGNAGRLIWEASGQPVVVKTREFSGEAGSAVTFTVPHPDQPGFIDGAGNEIRNWSYTASVVIGDQQWTQSFQPKAGTTEVDLDLVRDGQVAVPSSAPVPFVTSVNGETGAVVIPTGDGGDGTVAWDDVLDKPSTYIPTTHAHPISEVAGLQGALDGKQAAGNYVADDDARLSDARTPVTHSHAMGEVTGLDAALDNRVTTSTAMHIDYGTALPPAGQAGRFFIIIPDAG